MAVRYDKKFMNEIKNVVNAYNRKITRLSKANKYKLPAKFDNDALEMMKKTSVSRKDVRRRLQELETFTKRGGEKNIRVGSTTMPKYLYTNIKRYQRLLKYQTTLKLKRFETTKPISSGKEEPLTFAQLGSEDYLTTKSVREKLLNVDLESMTDDEIASYLNKLRSNTKTIDYNKWQSSYIDIIQDTALSYGYDENKLDEIVRGLNLLTPEAFDELSFKDKNIQAIINYYKALLDIGTAEDLAQVSEDVRANLDAIYDNLTILLQQYTKDGKKLKVKN